jgi:endonuclease/exonuclease/phosphatase family metal-dependent hydrolase
MPPETAAGTPRAVDAVAIQGIVFLCREMRVLTYNVHSCIGTDQKLAPARIAGVIARANADVVCLQEIELCRARTNHEDQAALIAEMLGMAFEFHPTISREPEHFGDAILSRHPMTLKRKATFPPVPNPIPNENRGAIWAVIEIEGTRWNVVNTHFGLGREERRLQALHFASEWIAPALPGPLVICGDFNSRPGSRVHGILSEKVTDIFRLNKARRPRTFSTNLPVVCLDYIYVSPKIAVDRAEVINDKVARVASDHYPLIAELRPTP